MKIKEFIESYNIFKVIIDFITGKLQYVSNEEHERRMKICKSCDKMVKIIANSEGSCSICGCFINLKTKYEKSTCPDNPPKW